MSEFNVRVAGDVGEVGNILKVTHSVDQLNNAPVQITNSGFSRVNTTGSESEHALPGAKS